MTIEHLNTGYTMILHLVQYCTVDILFNRKTVYKIVSVKSEHRILKKII